VQLVSPTGDTIFSKHHMMEEDEQQNHTVALYMQQAVAESLTSHV
jgi:hypothetical protein